MNKFTSNLQTIAFSLTLLSTPVALASEAAKEIQPTNSLGDASFAHKHKEFKAKQHAEKEEFKAQQKKVKEECKAKLKEAKEEFKAKQKAEKKAFHSMKS